MEARALFLNLFTVCSLYQQKFVVYPFVEEETNESFLFANRLNRLNGLKGLTHLCHSDDLEV